MYFCVSSYTNQAHKSMTKSVLTYKSRIVFISRDSTFLSVSRSILNGSFNVCNMDSLRRVRCIPRIMIKNQRQQKASASKVLYSRYRQKFAKFFFSFAINLFVFIYLLFFALFLFGGRGWGGSCAHCLRPSGFGTI